MKRKSLALSIIVAAFALMAGNAAGQGSCYNYQVAYVSATMNIRQSHNINTVIVRKAAAGESFAISSSTQGQTYCWLDIAEGWMAWTSRVGSAPADGATSQPADQSTQPSDIDNCCFVNRHCQSEQDWVDGYWAHQRNECPASDQTPQQTVSQPVSTTPVTVNNCCFVDRQCTTDQNWVDGYWAYQNGLCGGGQVNPWTIREGNIVIEGSETFQIWVKAGLDLLRRTAPQWYDYVQGATRRVKERPAGTYVLIHVESGTHETAWDANAYPNDLNIYTIAHEMIHEACHFYQYMEGRPSYGLYAEKECLEAENAATPFFDPNDRWGRRQRKIETAANLEHDPSLWWWGEIAECRRNTVDGIGC